MNTQKIDLLSLLPEELEQFLLSLGEPKYRAKQMFSQMHKGVSPDEMTNVGKKLKEALSESACYYLPKIKRKLVSRLDGTVKYLFELADGNSVESVVMKYNHGNTVCVSSQVGCRMGCAFCASTIGGKVRDLAPSEILGQVLVAQNDTGERISNIVMMGIGEPLDNYDNIIKFLHLLNSEEGLNISYRNISLSTCGLADRIIDLAKEDLPITLCISLHNPIDEQRSLIMPVNRKYALDKLLDACNIYRLRTNRRITFEYALIKGVNDSPEHATRLVNLIKGILCHVNLIPVNEVSDTGYVTVDKDAVEKFKGLLEKDGINVTVRRSLGRDIEAACGQLRRSAINGEE